MKVVADRSEVVARVSAAVGLSYNGYVAYSMVAMYGPEVVERVVICCCAMVGEEKDLREGVFVFREVDLAAEVLTPQTQEKMMEMLRYVTYKKPRSVPRCLLNDFIDQPTISVLQLAFLNLPAFEAELLQHLK